MTILENLEGPCASAMRIPRAGNHIIWKIIEKEGKVYLLMVQNSSNNKEY